jgi:hypothetical protein
VRFEFAKKLVLAILRTKVTELYWVQNQGHGPTVFVGRVPFLMCEHDTRIVSVDGKQWKAIGYDAEPEPPRQHCLVEPYVP